MVAAGNQITAADIYIILKMNCNRQTRSYKLLFSFKSFNLADHGTYSRWQYGHRIIHLKTSTYNPSGIAAIIMKIIRLGSDHPLNRHSGLHRIIIFLQGNRFQMIQKALAFVPIHSFRTVHNIVSFKGTYRNKSNIMQI